jgi:glycosyltransferase involved in cell wall biosynthesis
VAAGKAIISTSYLHARFLLGESRGLLVDFASAESISEAALRVLDAPELQAELEWRTRAYGQRLRWAEVGARYRNLLRGVFSQRPKPHRRVAATRTVVVPAAASLAGSAAQ